jgi:hypothetical protein
MEIGIDDKGIFCYEAPEKSHYVIDDDGLERYQKALEQTKRDRVYFKPEDVTDLLSVIGLVNGKSEQGKSYPVPDGYEVKKMLQKRWGDKWHDLPDQESGRELEGIYQYVAILVPKQEPCKFGGVPDNCNNETCWDLQECQRPILVPKEKVKPFDNGGQVPAYGNEKQQSIEEAMKQKTAIRQLKDKINDRIDHLMPFDNIHSENRVIELRLLLQELESLEPVNEQQIKDAFDIGNTIDGIDKVNDGNQYFNETFEKPQSRSPKPLMNW